MDDEECAGWRTGRRRTRWTTSCFGHLRSRTCSRLTFHNLEAWNEKVVDGAWGDAAAALGERMRRSVDFDHWAAFEQSFLWLTGSSSASARATTAGPPATIGVLSGDVHHAYLADVAFRKERA